MLQNANELGCLRTQNNNVYIVCNENSVNDFWQGHDGVQGETDDHMVLSLRLHSLINESSCHTPHSTF